MLCRITNDEDESTSRDRELAELIVTALNDSGRVQIDYGAKGHLVRILCDDVVIFEHKYKIADFEKREEVYKTALEGALDALPLHANECGCEQCEAKEAVRHALEVCGNCGAPGPLAWCPDCKKRLCGGCDTTDPHGETEEVVDGDQV